LAESKKEKLPLVDKDGKLCGLITVKDIEKIKQYPLAAKDKYGRLLCGAGVGITKDLWNGPTPSSMPGSISWPSTALTATARTSLRL
jgi:hypothetical protein